MPAVSEAPHGQGVIIGASLFFLLLTLELVRRRKIDERFSLLWVVVAAGMFAFSSIAYPVLLRLAPLTGIVYPPTALFLLAFLGLVALSMYLTVVISHLRLQNRKMAQDLALLHKRQQEFEQRSGYDR